jgi:hypothetical protein
VYVYGGTMRFQFLTKIYYLNEKNMNEETTKTDIPYRTKKQKWKSIMITLRMLKDTEYNMLN